MFLSSIPVVAGWPQKIWRDFPFSLCRRACNHSAEAYFFMTIQLSKADLERIAANHVAAILCEHEVSGCTVYFEIETGEIFADVTAVDEEKSRPVPPANSVPLFDNIREAVRKA